MKFYIITVSFALSAVYAFSQTGSSDTSFLEVSKQNMIAFYEQSIADQKLYYNGGAYQEPRRTGDDHPFYLSDDWLTGDLYYDGNEFKNVSLMYDITGDIVLAENKYATPIALVKEKLSRFTLDRRVFEKVFDESVNGSLPRTGFYHVVYPGKTKVLALHEKDLQERIEHSTVNIFFEQKNRYFIRVNDQYHPVTGQRSVIKLLADQKNALKSFIRSNRINFKINREDALLKVAQQYDTFIATAK